MTKKPDETHFSCNQNQTKSRVTVPFVYADRYDPREVRKYHGYVMKTDKVWDDSKSKSRPNLSVILSNFVHIGG